MTEWKGMNIKHTPVFKDSTLAILAQNQRFKINGEMQRRPGLSGTNLDQLADPVTSLWGGCDYGNYVISQSGSTLIGERDPQMLWGEPVVIPPIVIKGNAVAPVINAVDGSPLSPPATYPVGVVTFTPNITYDGLSGALIYSWTDPMTDNGVAFANAVGLTNLSTCQFNFDAGATPGLYTGSLLVQTTLNGFSVGYPYTYTVI